MKKNLCKILFLVLISLTVTAQNCGLKNGDKAQPLVLNNNQFTLQSITFPYINKIVLIHFWASSVNKSKSFLARAVDLHERYSNATYRNAEGFEVITVAIQSDKSAWNQDLAALKMDKMMNLIANKGYNDLSVRNYKLTQLPVTILVDELGTILSINPTMLQIEDILDAKKNSPQNAHDLKGRLLFSEAPSDGVKNQKMVMMNKFNDTISRTLSDNSGLFTYFSVKYLPEYIIKADTAGDLTGKQKAYLSTASGAVFANVPKASGKFEYLLSLGDVAKLSGINKDVSTTKNAISFNANITFKKNSSELESSSNIELDKVATMLSKNKDYTVEIISHTDSKGDDADNLELSKKRSSAVKAYLVGKGIAPIRMKPIGKGETELKNKCKNKVACTDDEHAENVRTELKFYKP
jgi:outer membrane protein OmpA-like peptidoglycan-associated protein